MKRMGMVVFSEQRMRMMGIVVLSSWKNEENGYSLSVHIKLKRVDMWSPLANMEEYKRRGWAWSSYSNV